MQDDPSKHLARSGLTRQVRTESRFRAVSQNTAGSSTGHPLLGSPGSLLGQPLAELEAGACAELAGARCGVSMNRSDSKLSRTHSRGTTTCELRGKVFQLPPTRQPFHLLPEVLLFPTNTGFVGRLPGRWERSTWYFSFTVSCSTEPSGMNRLPRGESAI